MNFEYEYGAETYAYFYEQDLNTINIDLAGIYDSYKGFNNFVKHLNESILQEIICINSRECYKHCNNELECPVKKVLWRCM